MVVLQIPTNKWAILVATIPVALSSGTLFAFSVYAIQLADRCKIPSSVTANLSISATIGTSIGGLLAGYVADLVGLQIPMFISFILLTVGYRWLEHLYYIGPAAKTWMLLSALFIIGFGSVSSYFASLKAVTVCFPSYKGSAQSVTISSFAISSLIYSNVNSALFDGDVPRFLLFLVYSCAIMQFIGVLFIRVESNSSKNTGGSSYRMLNEHPEDASVESNTVAQVEEATDLDLEQEERTLTDLKHLNLRQSLTSPVFWAHFALMAIVQGLGQMYIYCVGYIIKATYYHYTHISHTSELIPSLHSLQALHVSLIAVGSFMGRVASGPMTDTLINRFKCQRHWVTALGVTVLFCGHIILSFPFDMWLNTFASINLTLCFASSFIGFAYGLSFTTFPAILSDLFSMENYSLLWGLMYCSTLPGMTLLTKVFGHIYDRNSVWIGDDYTCTKGSYCYLETFHVTSSLAVVVFCGIMLFIYISHHLW